MSAREILETTQWGELVAFNVSAAEGADALRVYLGDDRAAMAEASQLWWDIFFHGPAFLPAQPAVVRYFVALLGEWAAQPQLDAATIDLVEFLQSLGRWVNMFKDQHREPYAAEAAQIRAAMVRVDGNVEALDLFGELEAEFEASQHHAGYELVQLAPMVVTALTPYREVDDESLAKACQQALTHWVSVVDA